MRWCRGGDAAARAKYLRVPPCHHAHVKARLSMFPQQIELAAAQLAAGSHPPCTKIARIHLILGRQTPWLP